MQVDVDLTEDDLWRGARRAAWHDPPTRRNLLVNAAAPIVAVWILGAAQGLPWVLTLTLIVVTTPLAWGLLWTMARRRVRALVQQPGVLGSHAFAITPEGFHERTAYNVQLTAWTAIHSVRRDEHALYVHLAPLTAFVLPLRHFRSREAADAFEDELRRHLAAVRSGA